MKRFLLVALLLVSAASVYAADLKITGDAEVRGIMDNKETDGNRVLKNKFFDADFNFNMALVVTENTTVFTKLTFDSEGGLPSRNDGTFIVPDQEAADYNLATETHTFLGVERAYISTKFLPALTVDAGLMGGGAWGTAFGNTETNITRIKGTYAVDENMSIIAIYEKNLESSDQGFTAAAGAPTAGDNTTDFGDTTTYYLAAKLKFGAITVLPLIKYSDMQTNAYLVQAVPVNKGDENVNLMGIDLAVNGDMGMIGFEAEVIYTLTSYDGLHQPLAGFPKYEDSTKYGAYVNVFAKLDPATVGVAAFYASADKKEGNFNTGEDFDFVLVAEDLNLTTLTGMTAAKVYADAKFMEKFSAGATFAYGMATDKDVTGDDSFWEVDANVNYLIDAATTYTIEGGYASLDLGAVAASTVNTKQYRVLQKFSVKF